MNQLRAFARPSVWFALLVALGLLLLPLTLISYLLLRDAVNPPWREVLSDYLRYRNQGLSQTLIVKIAVRATRPDRFTRAMSRISYGNSVHYRIDSGDSSYLGGRPLPYPPDEVWCVLLVPASGAPSPQQAVFVARHLDEYTGDWVVHQAGGDFGSSHQAQTLAVVGCDLALR